jgi:diketogulonate reductase-like aldo/keto reductase
MERMTPWIPRLNGYWFIGAKTAARSRLTAWGSIRSCQKRLGVDTFDLFQLHGVTSHEELDEVTATGGALEALVEMREQGLTRYIDITGHGPNAPRIQLEALARFDFDAIMFPLTPALFLHDQYRRDAQGLIETARERNVGIQAIKMLARGGWGDSERDLALWWVLSQPVHTAPSTRETKLLPLILESAARFRPLDAVAQTKVVASQRPPRPEPLLGILAVS